MSTSAGTDPREPTGPADPTGPAAAPAGPHEPGALGYALATLATVLVWSVGAAGLLTLADSDESYSYLGTLLIVLVVAVPSAAGLGLVVALVLHLLCRRRPSQAVHVAAAGLIAAAVLLVAGALDGAVRGGWDTLAIGLWAGVSAAIGRALVVPMVAARRRRSTPS
ncbi:hypothetical protein [Nocardioides sp.]|uniref:hypothetical protein n=1 Tax=Nocardioides sp. TaxID=35761 RepID=UPI003517C5C9